MNAIFKKLNFKDQAIIYVLNAPESFRAALEEIHGSTQVAENVSAVKKAGFALAFVQKKSEVDRFADQIARLADGDAVVWLAYPKGTSKKYTCEFNRDNGWDRLGAHGFEPVRQVSIDEDWSALRFRRVEHIKALKRKTALSKEGKNRIATN